MPTWLKLIATAVARARSSAPNHVAERSGGVHWNIGCAAPTRTVPATTALYGCRPIDVGRPLRSAQPAAIVAGSREYAASHVSGAAATEKHTQSESSASSER